MFEVVILAVIPMLTKYEFDTLLSFVSVEKKERVKRFRFFRDAQNCLLGDILARIAICQATGLSNKQLKFLTNDYGKPFLVNCPYIHFNISHTGNYVACAISDESVGVDIELIKPIDLKIAERFFMPDEKRYVMNDDQERRFYEVWTKKESRIKWEGKGLSKSLTSFSVFDSTAQEIVFYHQVYCNNEAMCYVCSRKKDKPNINMIDTIALTSQIYCAGL